MKLTDVEGTRLSSEISHTRIDLTLAKHWTGKPNIAGSIPVVVR